MYTRSNTLSWVHVSLPLKQHLDRFIRFCSTHRYAEHTDTQTQTAERATRVAIGRTYAIMG